MSSSQVPRRLYRPRTNRRIAGVCGGIAEYLNVDPTLVRLGFVLLTILNGAGLLIYIIMAIVVPEAPTGAPSTLGPAPLDLSWIGVGIALLIGLGLISFGLAWMTDQVIPWTWMFWGFWSWLRDFARFFWALAVIVAGLIIIVAALKRK